MRHFFESSSVQTHLYKSGQIDRGGRVIDLEANKGRLHIIEKEFAFAEREEDSRQKEEVEMRRRVQIKRHQALDRARAEEKLIRMKEDRNIRREIGSAMREAQGLGSYKSEARNDGAVVKKKKKKA
jgi:hypothetical protein